MEIKDLTAILVVAMVGCILVAGFVPVVGESVSATTTFENDGYFYMQKITAEDTNTYTFHYVYDPDTGAITLDFNDEPVNMTNWPTSPYPVTVATDTLNWVVRMGHYSEYTGLQGMGYGFAFGGHNAWDVTITFSAGSANASVINSSDVTTQYNTTYTDMWIYSPVPTDFVMKKLDKSAYMLEDSEFIAVGITSMTAWNTAISISGTVESFNATIIYPPNLTTTVTNENIYKTAVDDYNDLYTLDKITFTINDGTTTVNATYSYFIVPAKVVAEKAIHADDNTASIVSMIPFILIMGIVLMFVGVVLVRRYV